MMVAKYAIAFGGEVSIFARNMSKKKDAIQIGCKKLYNSIDNVEEKFDLIISTMPTNYQIESYLN